MNNFFFNIAAKFVNSDVIGGWVRNGVAYGLGFLTAKYPALIPLFTPEVMTAIQSFLSILAIGAWSQASKSLTSPTATQTVAVAKNMAATGLISNSTVGAVVENPKIAMPETGAAGG